jgi:hypothetical protein
MIQQKGYTCPSIILNIINIDLRVLNLIVALMHAA